MPFYFVILLLLIPVLCFSQQNPSIHSVYFNHNYSKFSSSEKKNLDSVLNRIIKDQISKITIEGYTDFTGKEEYNYKLAFKRANQVSEYFKVNGYSGTIIPIAIGEISPDSEQSKLKSVREHRRVDIIYFSEAAKKDLGKLIPGQKLILPGLYFLPGRHIPTDSSYSTLKTLSDFLILNPNAKIEIQGHICCEPNLSDGYDLDTREYKLSNNRARFVYEYLIKNGIDSSRLTFKGLGRKFPLINHEITEEDKNINRRVEIFLKEK
ncbi:MAG: OmpA family protein [Cytophagaceae bacterium]